MAESAWPRAGQRVEVEVEEPSRLLLAVVDDVRPPEQVHLREPVEPSGAPTPEVAIGASVAVRWTSAAGQHVLPSTLVEHPRTRTRLWKLAPDSEPVVIQRRNYVRVPETLRVTLRRGDELWIAGLCDLSEGGARCAVLTPNDLSEGDSLHMLLTLGEHELDLPAAVIGVAVDDERRRTTARLRFDVLGREADLLRHRVLELQRRARAAGLR